MSEPDYKQVKAWVDRHGIHQHPSEVHGLITGWICAGSRWDANDREATLSGWLSLDLDKAESRILEDLYRTISEGLVDQEFGFLILMPDDEANVNDRSFAVSAWCSGFLAGFGMTGRYQDSELSEDVSEVLTDLGRIASLSTALPEEVPEDEENEADLIEISEYVRMSALLVFTECGQRSVH